MAPGFKIIGVYPGYFLTGFPVNQLNNGYGFFYAVFIGRRYQVNFRLESPYFFRYRSFKKYQSFAAFVRLVTVPYFLTIGFIGPGQYVGRYFIRRGVLVVKVGKYRPGISQGIDPYTGLSRQVLKNLGPGLILIVLVVGILLKVI
jgi:hypothetical protein